MPNFTITPAEAGQKLLQCLMRRLRASQSDVHRWIRTGQVRVNGGRRKAFDRVDAGDDIRLPPFAELDTGGLPENDDRVQQKPLSSMLQDEGRLPLTIVHEDEDVVVLCKPAGLPTHPGTGHTDSVTTRLHAACAGWSFAPTPVHRLDRDTSGLLLIAKRYAALRRMSDAFAEREGVSKEYVAWCVGTWPHTCAVRLESNLEKVCNSALGREQMCGVPDGSGKAAALTVVPLRRLARCSLVRIVLHTGRTHQIRVQMAEAGYPLVGDAKYGGEKALRLIKHDQTVDGLLLHAWRLQVGGQFFTVLPTWNGAWRVDDAELV